MRWCRGTRHFGVSAHSWRQGYCGCGYAVGGACLLTASKDSTLRLWAVAPLPGLHPDGRGTVQIREASTFRGHEGGVEAVSTNVAFVGDGGPGARMLACSGSRDKTLRLWTLGDDGASSHATKRRRKGSRNSSNSAGAREKLPTATMHGHAGSVSAVAWANPSTVYSGSLDQSIRSWDIERTREISALHGPKIVTSVDFSDKLHALASGHPDHLVRLWDARAAGDTIVKAELASHTDWVSGVAWSRSHEFLLLSTSYDQSVKVSDVRSSTPLHSIHGPHVPSVDDVRPRSEFHTAKILCVDVCQSAEGRDSVFTGGADAALHVMTH